MSRAGLREGRLGAVRVGDIAVQGQQPVPPGHVLQRHAVDVQHGHPGAGLLQGQRGGQPQS